MNILLIGSGGREHALAWKLAQAEKVDTVFVAPGNAGTELEDKMKNVPIGVEDFDNLLKFALENEIDLTVVGPEAPLKEHRNLKGQKHFQRISLLVIKFQRLSMQILQISMKQ